MNSRYRNELDALTAAGKVVLDGVFNAVTDAEGFRAEAHQGREISQDPRVRQTWRRNRSWRRSPTAPHLDTGPDPQTAPPCRSH